MQGWRERPDGSTEAIVDSVIDAFTLLMQEAFKDLEL